ncbi:MAG: restriction endonuclease subunit S [bacterium]|nr:restriction endonuclease subunit S [bacterium]
MGVVKYKDICKDNFFLAPSSYKWLVIESFVNKLSNKYENVFNSLKSIDGFAFPSSTYVTRYKDLKRKIPLIQIGNVNDSGWVITDKIQYEYLPDIERISRPKFLLNNEYVLVSLTGGAESAKNISTFYANDFAAFLNQRVSAITTKKPDERNLLLYFYALTKHHAFRYQWLGRGGVQKNTVADERKKIYLPLVNSQVVVRYIAALVESLINKEKTIRLKYHSISNLIFNELKLNQKRNIFEYNYPKYSEVKKMNRIDTGIYSLSFKEIDFLIKNYRNGYYCIDSSKIKSGNTPDVRFIGKNKELKYRWVTPTTCSDFGFLTDEERINLKGNNNINQDCLLIINRTSRGGRGEYVGISVFYDVEEYGLGHHNQGIYQVFNYSQEELILMTAFLNSKIMREYCACLSVGSKMKEIKSNQFLNIPFPNFPDSVREEIVALFRNPKAMFPKSENSINTFTQLDKEFDNQAGIVELDKMARKINKQLEKVLDQVMSDDIIKTNFDFMED